MRAPAIFVGENREGIMQPLETLKNEHGLIRQYLNDLEQAALTMKNGGRVPREFFDKALIFARNFADDYHHIKEEHMLFVRVAQKQQGKYDGQIEALRHQHETGRNHIAAIGAALDGYAAGNPVKADEILRNLLDYVPLLRDHIHTENHLFFPMAQEQLTEDELAQLQVEFDRAREKAGSEVFETYQKIVTDMGSILSHA